MQYRFIPLNSIRHCAHRSWW